MQPLKEKKPVSLEEDTGLSKVGENELYEKTNLETVNILGKVKDEKLLELIKNGHPNFEYVTIKLVKELCLILSPYELYALLSDPNCVGMYEAEEQVRDNLVNFAAYEFFSHSKSSELSEYYDKYFLIRHFGNKAVMAHKNEKGQLVAQTIGSFKESQTGRFATAINPTTGEMVRKNLAKVFLESTMLKSYETMEFLPGLEAQDGVFNLWNGWPFKDNPNDSFEEPESCRLYLKHVKENICGGDLELYEFLLAWMAHALLYPYKICPIAVVLSGPQGSGKGVFALCFSKLFGRHFCILNNPDQLTGKFNKHLMESMLVFADEAFFAGNHQQAATLKTLITSPEIPIELKGVDSVMMAKYFRLIMASNDPQVIRAEKDDRRFFVLNVDAGENNNSNAYFGAIIKQMEAGGYEALFNWLRGASWREYIDSGEWSPDKRPKTRALAAQKDLSLEPPEMVVHNMLMSGDPACEFLNQPNGCIFVSTKELAKETKLGVKGETPLGNVLRKVGVIGANGKVKNCRKNLSNGKSARGYILPPLAEARLLWESHLGRDVEWPEEITEWGEVNNPEVPF